MCPSKRLTTPPLHRPWSCSNANSRRAENWMWRLSVTWTSRAPGWNGVTLKPQTLVVEHDSMHPMPAQRRYRNLSHKMRWMKCMKVYTKFLWFCGAGLFWTFSWPLIPDVWNLRQPYPTPWIKRPVEIGAWNFPRHWATQNLGWMVEFISSLTLVVGEGYEVGKGECGCCYVLLRLHFCFYFWNGKVEESF